MAWGSVTLVPGVNVERTPTLLRTGISQSALVRFKDALVQKLGGWAKFIPFPVAGIPRDLHAWKDLNNVNHLSVGTTTNLTVITGTTRTDISPQIITSDFAPNISTTSGSAVVSITDPDVMTLTVFDSVFFNVPVSHGGLILDGLYPITQIGAPGSYQITAPTAATITETNPNPTNAPTAAGNNTLHFATTPTWLQAGMVIFDLDHPLNIPASTTVVSTTVNTVVMSNNAIGTGVFTGDNIVFSSVPVFSTTSGSSTVTVTFISHGVSVGNTVVFQIPTTGNGITIQGAYTVASVVDVNNFKINGITQATATGQFAMNGGKAELVYHIAIGPPPLGAGFGLGGFGSGGFGTGVIPAAQGGIDITAVDWTSDNWGEILIACPTNGAIYYYDPTGAFQNAQVIQTAPPINTGIFVSMAQQILVAFGSSQHQAIGWLQNPLLVSWSDVSNFFNWTVSSATQAGSDVISNGSAIIGAMAVSNQNLIWTDVDLWAMSYIGPPFVYGFNKIGAGAGLVSMHAAQPLRGSVYWMGRTNFYRYASGGAEVIPCPVWDAVFQNINTGFLKNIRSMPNTPFNEVGWLYPSAASVSGECDSYVKFNITEPGAPWDYGPMQRSAWIDQSVFGMPIAATSQGILYQHEVSPDADTQPLMASFTTGYFYLQEGEDFASIDRIYPDFIWGTFSGTPTAHVILTFNVTNYPGDTPRTYGPYVVTQATEFLSVRFRGRQMSITVQSSDIGSFWRLGHIRYRFSTTGRR